MKSHVGKEMCKNFENCRVIAIFVRLTKIQRRVNKNQEQAGAELGQAQLKLELERSFT